MKTGEEWVEQARKFFVAHQTKQIHLVGVGNPIRGDDSVGLLIASGLRKRFGARPSKFVRIHSSSTSPEVLLSKIGANKDPLMIFDAIEHNSEPGEIIFANLGDTRFGFFATHNIPLKLIPNLSENIDRSFVLGVQPGNVDIGEVMSQIVVDSANRVIDELAKLIEVMKPNASA